MKNLFLFTDTFPYNGAFELSFLEFEIKSILSSKKYDLYLIPAVQQGKLYDDFTTIKSLDEFSLKPLSSMTKFLIPVKFIFSSFFWRSLLKYPKTILNPKTFISYAISEFRINRMFTKMSKYIDETNLNLTNSIFYTFWFSTDTRALVRLKEKRYPELKIISKAHGSDLYEYLSPKLFRSTDLEKISAVFSVSEYGQKYLKSQYPQFSSKFHTSKIGIQSSNFKNLRSQDNVVRIVSCSSVIPLKRVTKIFESIKLFANTYQRKTNWTHFGAGSEFQELEALIESNEKSLYLECELKGHQSHEQVLVFYEKNSVDLFINLSTTEGLPVSIMEAMSYQIPIVATDVGGVSELVSEENGTLVNKDFSIKNVATAIDSVLSQDQQNLRTASYRKWEINHDGSTIYKPFLEHIYNI